jgi:hypothetical protein
MISPISLYYPSPSLISLIPIAFPRSSDRKMCRQVKDCAAGTIRVRGKGVFVMNEQVAFLSLARRLGNPIADQPETIAAIEDYDLVSAFRALPPRHRRVVRLTLDCLARWHRPKDPQRH